MAIRCAFAWSRRIGASHSVLALPACVPPLTQSNPTLSAALTGHTRNLKPRAILPPASLARDVSGEFQFLFDIERELNHPLSYFGRPTFQQVSKHQLLNVQPHEIAQLERPTARSEDKVAVAAVHDNQVAVGIESRAPQFPRGPFERVLEVRAH